MIGTLIALLVGTVMFGGPVQAQEFAPPPSNVPHLLGIDLYKDLAQVAGKPSQYVGKQVVITDADVFMVDNHGALFRAGTIAFSVTTKGIDPETFRYFLENCNGGGCKVHLLVTPTGGSTVMDGPELADVKIVK
jgi:hypothetical protein